MFPSVVDLINCVERKQFDFQVSYWFLCFHLPCCIVRVSAGTNQTNKYHQHLPSSSKLLLVMYSCFFCLLNSFCGNNTGVGALFLLHDNDTADGDAVKNAGHWVLILFFSSQHFEFNQYITISFRIYNVWNIHSSLLHLHHTYTVCIKIQT